MRKLLALLILIVPLHAFASVTLVQKTNANANATTVAATLTGVATGDCLVIVVAGNSGATTPSSVVDSSGDTVSAAVAYATTTSRAGVGVYYVQNTSSGSHTITVTWGASNLGEVFVVEYSGLLTSGVFDVASAVAFGASTTVATGSITPASNGELLIFGIGQQNGSLTFSAYTNGFTQEDHNATTNAPSCAWADQVQATAASISGGATSSSSNGWGAAIAAFKASAAPTLKPAQFFFA